MVVSGKSDDGTHVGKRSPWVPGFADEGRSLVRHEHELEKPKEKKDTHTSVLSWVGWIARDDSG